MLKKIISICILMTLIFPNVAYGIEIRNNEVILTQDEFNNLVNDLRQSEVTIEGYKKQSELDKKHIDFLNAKIITLENLHSGKDEDYKEIIKRHEENFNLQKEQTQYWNNKYTMQKSLSPFRNVLYLLIGAGIGALSSK